MEITLQEDLDPDLDFYYRYQFRIYDKAYLIWDRATWKAALTTCTVYRIDVDGQYAGDVLLEDQGKGTKSVVDFSILPEYQGKGVGKAALEKVKKMAARVTAVTREETLNFFLKSGFVVRKRTKNYYARGVDGYFIAFSNPV